MKKCVTFIFVCLCIFFVGCSNKDVSTNMESYNSNNIVIVEYDINEGESKMSIDNIVNIYPQLHNMMVNGKPAAESTKPAEKPFVSSDASITFSYEYISDGDIIPYGLYTPSTAKTNEKTPLIIWLHGSGEKGVSESTFANRGLPNVLNNWKLQGFNAYVACPQLTGEFNTGAWMKDDATEYINSLISKLKSEYKIDEERIILCGHSLGGQGTTYIANVLPDLFSCIAPLSGYDCWSDLKNIDIPIRGYVGSTAYGEDDSSYNYMVGKFKDIFPDAEVFVLDCSHGDLPDVAFNIDDNGDSKSDLIEWMLNNKREVVM